MSRYTSDEAMASLFFGVAALTVLVLVLWPMAAGGQAAPAWLVGILVPTVPAVLVLGGVLVVHKALLRRVERVDDLGTADLLHAAAKAETAEEKLARFEERGTFVITCGLWFVGAAIVLMLPGHLSQGVGHFLTSGAVWTLLAWAALMLAVVALVTGGMWALHAVRYHWWQAALGQYELD